MVDQEGRLVSVAIEVSRFDEDPTNAFESVVACKEYIADVHIVRAGGVPETDPLWGGLAKRLNEAGIDKVCVHADGTLDVKRLRCMALVRVPSDMIVTSKAFGELVHDMVDYAGVYDHYAVTSTLSVDRFEVTKDGSEEVSLPISAGALYGALSYGFLLVVLAFDTLRSFATLFRYHRTCDLRGQMVYHAYPNRVQLARRNWLLWWFYTGISPPRRVDNSCAQAPAVRDQGWTFTLRYIRTHASMGWGVWWIFGFAAYYYLFSIPWWVWWRAATVGVEKGSTILFSWWMIISPREFFTYMISTRDLGAIHWLSFHTLHLCFVAYLVHQHVRTPFGLLLFAQTLLYPVYLTLAPIMFLLARWMPIRTIARPKQ